MRTRLSGLCLLMVMLGLLTACRRYDDVERYGVFTLTRHMVVDRIDWEGGNTGMISATLCSQVDRRCEKADDFNVRQPVDKTRIHHRIAVFLRDDSGDDFSRTLAFHDAETGVRLRCGNCVGDIEARIAGHDPVQDLWGDFTWGPTGATGIASFAEGADRIRLVLLEFDADGYRAVPLVDLPASTFDRGSIAIAPDDVGIGWYACDPQCTLFAFDRERRLLLATEVPCEYNSYLDIGWIGARAYAQHYWGASERNMCFTTDGRPALPRGERPEWMGPRDGEPPIPETVEQLPPAEVRETIVGGAGTA